MNKPKQIRFSFFCILTFLPFLALAQTVGIFYNAKVPQIQFAAQDIKTALESRKLVVEMLPLSDLKSSYPNKKVVITLNTDLSTSKELLGQGGSTDTGLTEQAYSIKTTTKPQKSYWIVGADANGAMYGGLQLAEDIKFNEFKGNYNTKESPTILKRGIKLNLPWDKVSGTYGIKNMGTYDGTSSQLAIKDVWDMSFWTEWFDEMARNRYNTVSLWSCNPFSSLVVVPGYEDCSINNVTYFDGTVRKMTIDEKIKFWREVMAYAHDRGFEFLMFNWNVFTYGATDKYGITEGKKGEINPVTRDYMYKAMIQLLETYPDFDGFGLSIGENKGTEDFVWNTYGKAMYDYAKKNPNRKLRFIHRLHYGDFQSMVDLFSPLKTLPNVNFNISVKHSQAHMYSTPKPNWWPKEIKSIKDNNFKTWLTVRNDDFYYLTWGDPAFAREYIAGMLEMDNILEGFYMGCDGYNPTRSFFNKKPELNGQLEVLRQQYMMKIWGRLTYNPNTSDAIFKNYMAVKYPKVKPDDLFTAWSKASKSVQCANEILQGNFMMDYMWLPEACQRDNSDNANPKKIKRIPFVSVQDFSNSKVGPGSQLCSISESATGNLNGKKSSYVLADEVEADGLAALKIVKKMKVPANSDQDLAIKNINALSYLGLYYSYKIRAATYLKANDNEKAKNALGTAYAWWMNYSNLMDSMYFGMTNQRSTPIENWHVHDESVLKEYTDLGGVGVPQLQTK